MSPRTHKTSTRGGESVQANVTGQLIYELSQLTWQKPLNQGEIFLRVAMVENIRQRATAAGVLSPLNQLAERRLEATRRKLMSWLLLGWRLMACTTPEMDAELARCDSVAELNAARALLEEPSDFKPLFMSKGAILETLKTRAQALIDEDPDWSHRWLDISSGGRALEPEVSAPQTAATLNHRTETPSITHLLETNMPDIIDIPAAPTSSDAATAPATANPMKGMLARIDALNAQNIARSTRMTEVEPLLGGAKYDLPSITARIQENAATMAQAAMQIGASLIAVKTVEGHGEFDKWLETAGLPFRRSMAYMFISNTRKVLMDERLLPVLGLGISKAELLLRAVTDADAEELAEHGTIQGRPLDAYDAMGRRELEAQVRGLREERDKLAEKVENAKTEVKAVRLAREEDMKERDKNVQDLKKELALARMPRTPDEEQAHVLQKFDEHLQKMRGIWYFIDPQAAAEIMINAPITHLAQVHIFFQEMFMMAKHHLLTFEKYAMVTSPAGIDAAIAQIDNMAYDTEKTPSFEEWEEQCRKEDEEEARKKGAGTIPFNRKR